MELLIPWIIIGTLVGGLIGKSKGNTSGGAVLGFLLRPIGWLITALIPADTKALEQVQLQQGMKKCPFCAELVKSEAKVCKHCGRDLPAAQMEANVPAPGAKCPYCGKQVAPNLEVCPHCRMRIAHIW